MSKRGRPVKEDGKHRKIQLRISEEEAKMLEYLCAETGENKSDTLRKGLRTLYNLEKHKSLLY